MLQQDRNNNRQGAFASHALMVRKLGLWPLPCGGDDGKKPMPNGYNRCKKPYAEKTINGFAKQWPDANLGILTGKSGLVVVDVDSQDKALCDSMQKRFGATSLITRTGSGNYHLWYKAQGGEEARDLRNSENIPVEIKAAGTLVIAPPSINFETGGLYEFERGSWDNLQDLPSFNGQGLPDRQSVQPTSTSNPNPVGTRNKALLSYLLQQALYCDNIDDLQDVADTHNERNHVKPERQSKVDSTVRKAWQYQIEGRNFTERPSWSVPHGLVDLLAPRTKGFDALGLYIKLQQCHGARKKPFCLATHNMAAANLLPGWKEKRYRNAKDVLLEFGLIERIAEGGRKKDGKLEAHLYDFLPLSHCLCPD